MISPGDGIVGDVVVCVHVLYGVFVPVFVRDVQVYVEYKHGYDCASVYKSVYVW